MLESAEYDPYAQNILVQQLGPILSRQQTLKKLTYLPAKPGDIVNIPKHIRLHMLMSLRDIHLPTLEGARLVQTLDVMIRQGYRYRDPALASTWGSLFNSLEVQPMPRAPAMAAVVVGHSGVGKTVAIQKGFDCYPSQVILHNSFPKLVGKHYQMLWQSVDVPSSGKTVDLAANLMIAWDETVSRYLPDVSRRFDHSLARERRDGSKMMDEWRRVAASHFLGVLHLDEVQNFFKIPTLEKRRQRKPGETGSIELSIIEDQALKLVLTLVNTWQMPVIVSGTPDGVGALTKRLSNVQRFVTSGYHKMSEFTDSTDKSFVDFLDIISQYQYVEKRLTIDNGLRLMIFNLTAGIHRLILALWIAAHRVAFDRKDDDLRASDFQMAATTYLSSVLPAVSALLSKDPTRMRRYEDLMPLDDGYWAGFWNSVTI